MPQSHTDFIGRSLDSPREENDRRKLSAGHKTGLLATVVRQQPSANRRSLEGLEAKGKASSGIHVRGQTTGLAQYSFYAIVTKHAALCFAGLP
jgi:hypothetical protein